MICVMRSNNKTTGHLSYWMFTVMVYLVTCTVVYSLKSSKIKILIIRFTFRVVMER